MEPRGLLLIEHRLIERMIEIIKKEISKIKKTNTVDPIFVDTAVDFIRIYADKTHHGKEENILFRECAKKSITKLMNELIEEHKFGRKTVSELVEAKEEYIKNKSNLKLSATKKIRQKFYILSSGLYKV